MYKYKLQYISDEDTLTYEFSADINANQMKNKLRDFLVGCSWSEGIVEDMLRLEDNDEE